MVLTSVAAIEWLTLMPHTFKNAWWRTLFSLAGWRVNQLYLQLITWCTTFFWKVSFPLLHKSHLLVSLQSCQETVNKFHVWVTDCSLSDLEKLLASLKIHRKWSFWEYHSDMLCHKEPPVLLLYNHVHLKKKQLKNINLVLSTQFLSDVFPQIESYIQTVRWNQRGDLLIL